MSPPSAPPVAILGAGPSGLMLARLLEINQIDYIVFERDRTPHEEQQGGTLDIHAESGQLALKAGGVYEQFKAASRSDGVSFKMADKDGIVQACYDQEEADRPEIDRKALRALLLASVPETKIRWNKKVRKVTRRDNGMTSVKFDDGTVAGEFKLLVGADGAWSKARSLLTSAKPQYSGCFYLTSTIKPDNPHHANVESFTGQGTYLSCGARRMVGAQRLGNGTYTACAGMLLPESEAVEAASWDRSKFKQWLLDNFAAEYGKINIDVIGNADEDFRPWPLYAMPPEALSWDSVPGVTLIGDAAHVTTPWAGEGVNCALFDSLELAQQIVKYGLDDLDTAIREYEKTMLPRGAQLITRSKENGDLIFQQDAPKAFVELMRWEDEKVKEAASS